MKHVTVEARHVGDIVLMENLVHVIRIVIASTTHVEALQVDLGCLHAAGISERDAL